ncbi:hypothetical protein AGRA3207_001367 [Actinomadura graeca]|uniref:Uncharacterized protein n=1 Tax=Actinomadura graeca TaxID=2750812 RepID=A0ABX8QRM2_9ACTN|nr:hypothetical protein [Actinomadura graeca]QXJ20619.1 hypothetical protein AGRA3207_001367 [Actinomadura graeca]
MPNDRHQEATTTTTCPPDDALAELRRDFTGHRIWRATRRDGRLGDWVASLHDPSAGIDPTVICSSPRALREALLDEADRAKTKRMETR